MTQEKKPKANNKRLLYIIYIILLVTLVTLQAFGGVFDMRSRVFISGLRGDKCKSYIPGEKFNKVPDPDEPDIDYIPAVVELADIADTEKLEQKGCIVLRTRENFAIVCIPVEALDEIAGSGILLGASVSQSLENNNLSRDFSNIAPVHERKRDNGLSGYRGRGVITGFCDIGFDPNHLAFKNRVALMIDYRLDKGQILVYDTPQEIAEAGPDRDYKSHGSHIANIMAGSVKDNPYYGYAPESEIVATTSDLYDASLLCGIEDIIAFARKEGKPCVINLSVGCFTGPRDGTDIVSRYLALLAREAPICFSAGNYGDGFSRKVRFRETFTDDTRPVGAFYENGTWKGFDVSGINDIWSDDSRKFEVSVAIFDYTDNVFVYRSPWMSGDIDCRIDSDNDDEFGRLYADSYINIAGGTDPNNGRYNIALSYSLHTTAKHTAGWSRYYTVALLRGPEGVSITSYADGSQSFFHTTGIRDTRHPILSGSASNFCFAPGIISVGAYNSRNVVPVLDSDPISFDFNVGEIAKWSSSETNIHGVSVPMFSAPGNQVISATNDADHNAHPENETICDEFTDADGRTYRWHYQCGTSMSSPAAAGIMACWLEADPTLTPAQLADIAVSTVRTKDIPDLVSPGWGAGAIDADAGLAKVLSMSVSGIRPDIAPRITVRDGAVYVEIPGCPDPHFTVCDISGKQLAKHGLAPGMYIVHVSAPCSTTAKIIVR